MMGITAETCSTVSCIGRGTAGSEGVGAVFAAGFFFAMAPNHKKNRNTLNVTPFQTLNQPNKTLRQDTETFSD